ncbi:SAM hydrolase/SAM-dependent halogenase family protein [Vulcanisaeta thermophila]|uniref:SAM hydrolase/SAM-dependent halogenase family protein n=1 Tax=Vulcanisaeta thermophila TaxID=867917 RepID=UPI000A009ABD|nr:S-adenosyl-l-methionine hydroxide adenosyltransferase family protein [Vulcanisaeta thermophila]
MSGVITLLTDFGYDSYFVPSMKAVILSINPRAVIVDITHAIPPFNIAKAAFTLWASYKYFPRGTVHVVVVDPGVGTSRRPIVVRTRNYYFVGPDNGVLMMAAEDDGVEEVRVIENRSYMRPVISHTFHGRDIFAPVAAHLSLGVDPSSIGPLINDPVRLPWTKPVINRGFARASIVYVDHFGNAYTNVRVEDLGVLGLDYGGELQVDFPRLGKTLKVRFLRTYGYANPGEALALINSEGFLELSIRNGNFGGYYGVSEGEEVVLRVLS